MIADVEQPVGRSSRQANEQTNTTASRMSGTDASHRKTPENEADLQISSPPMPGRTAAAPDEQDAQPAPVVEIGEAEVVDGHSSDSVRTAAG
jgi:hypothetical protein